MLYLVRLHLAVAASDRLIPRLAAETEIVHTHRQAISLEQPDALIPRQAQHIVARTEAIVQRLLVGMVPVVDPMFSPIIEKAQGSRGFRVSVLQRDRSHAAGYPLIVVDQRIERLAGIRSVEMGHVHVRPCVPMVGNFIAQLGIAAVLLEAHVRPMPVGPVVRAADDAREASLAYPVGQFGLQRIVRTVAGMQIILHAVLAHLARDDVHDSAHSVRAVKNRCRTAQHLDPLGHQRLVCVRYRMAEQPHILRVTVDQHEHPGRRNARLRRTAYAAQRHLAGRSARNAVTHDAASGGEQPRNPLRKNRQQRRHVGLLDPPPVHNGNGHRQMPDIGLAASAGHDHLPQIVRRSRQRIGLRRRRTRQTDERNQAQRPNDRMTFFHRAVNNCLLNGIRPEREHIRSRKPSFHARHVFRPPIFRYKNKKDRRNIGRRITEKSTPIPDSQALRLRCPASGACESVRNRPAIAYPGPPVPHPFSGRIAIPGRSFHPPPYPGLWNVGRNVLYCKETMCRTLLER